MRPGGSARLSSGCCAVGDIALSRGGASVGNLLLTTVVDSASAGVGRACNSCIFARLGCGGMLSRFVLFICLLIYSYRTRCDTSLRRAARLRTHRITSGRGTRSLNYPPRLEKAAADARLSPLVSQFSPGRHLAAGIFDQQIACNLARVHKIIQALPHCADVHVETTVDRVAPRGVFS